MSAVKRVQHGIGCGLEICQCIAQILRHKKFTCANYRCKGIHTVPCTDNLSLNIGSTDGCCRKISLPPCCCLHILWVYRKEKIITLHYLFIFQFLSLSDTDIIQQRRELCGIEKEDAGPNLYVSWGRAVPLFMLQQCGRTVSWQWCWYTPLSLHNSSNCKLLWSSPTTVVVRV